MRRGQAKLLVLFYEGEIAAKGWVQTWAPFRKKFAALTQADAEMLGPYETKPAFRGQGLYGLLLEASLYYADVHVPIFIYTHPNNNASARGIEKAGFSPMGQFEGFSVLRFFYRLRKRN
jgi:hypothetical protein